MNSISEFFISLFESIGRYSSSNGLGEHLRGLSTDCNTFSNQSIYNLVFLCILFINSFIVINYYFGLFNRVNFTNFITWILNLLSGSVIIFIIAFLYSNNDYVTQNYCKELNITQSDCIGFGITSSIYAFIWSLIISLIIKWKSSNNKKVPF